jgi:hypothetical protein
LASAFVQPDVYLSSAFCRQALSTAKPFDTAFEWHFDFAPIFLPAALNFAEVHLLCASALPTSAASSRPSPMQRLRVLLGSPPPRASRLFHLVRVVIHRPSPFWFCSACGAFNERRGKRDR